MAYHIEALDPAKAEGDEGLTTFRFKISRDHAADPAGEFERVHLKLDTPDINAFDGFSFSSDDGRIFGKDDARLGVAFMPGDTEKIITVSILGDKLVENNDIIRLSLTSFGVVNQTESSVTAKGIDGSASAVVIDDDTPAKHVADPFHVNLILQDGIVDDFEQNHILNPPNTDLLIEELLERIFGNLFASSQDGEYDAGEVAATDLAFLGNGIDGQYISARDNEIQAALFFDPPPQIDLPGSVSNPFAQILTPAQFSTLMHQIFLDGGQVSIEANNVVLAGDTITMPFGPAALDAIQYGQDTPIFTLGNGIPIPIDAEMVVFDGTTERLFVGLAPDQEVDVFTGQRAAFELSVVNGNRIQIVDTRPDSPDGTVFVENVALLKFADLHYDLAISQRAALLEPAVLDRLVELYIAYFNRVPEAGGLSYWIEAVLAGTSLDDVSAQFYQAGLAYSDLTGYSEGMPIQDFILKLYDNVLQRSGPNAPPQGDLDYWINEIETGAVTREGLAARFLADARKFYDHPEVGFVPRLLDQRLEFGKVHAITFGVDYADGQTAIERTTLLADAITPDNIDIAIELLGLGPMSVVEFS